MDSFLFAHKRIGIPLFDLSVQLNTISIRDQMIRALLLAERLPAWLQNELGLTFAQHPVLVVGGGVCGVTAAVALAQSGLTVEVAEKQSELFHLQRNCTSRWRDPTQYDWPVPTWRVQRFPQHRKHRQSPLTWKADFANRIAQEWGKQLSRHLLGGLASRLNLRRNLEADLRAIYLDQQRLLRVQFNDPQSGHAVSWGEYSAVIWAFGHGDERCNLANSPQFRGLPFWHSDTLEQDHCGLSSQTQEGTVLISGSGDGALQDYLRIVTRQRSVRAIYDQLQLDSVDIDALAILSADVCSERAINWSTGAAFATPYMQEIQDCHEQVVRSILSTPGLQARVNKLVARRPKRTVLVTRQDHFSCIYPLNRFLTLLILRGVNDSSVVWRRGLEVGQIQSIGVPPQSPTPLNCLGHSWRVRLHATQGSASPTTIDANVVLLRHGIDPPETSLPPGVPLPRTARPTPQPYLY